MTKKKGPPKRTKSKRTKIVAIGASAGGLDPYERFFDNTKDDLGVAFVIIQHLSPDFHSMMDELLSRHSKMDIQRVVHGMEIAPNTIYLNPPRTEMTVKSGKFELKEYSDVKQLNLPIDTFFNSLAEEMKGDAIAVVLSGTGSDGTKGAKAIKDAGGLVLAQDLSSAKFDGMPGSIVKLGYADVVGYPEMLAENVERHITGKPMVDDPQLGVIKSPTQRIFHWLRERFGTEFNYYKSATIDRRLERRASMRGNNMEEYAAVVAGDPVEAEALYADLLIEVTSFFRDPDSYEQLRTTIVPELAKSMSKTKPVRIWVPGCASGEEAYSIAILFADYARDNDLELHLKILATDIHDRSLDAASTGIYPRSSLGGLSHDQLDRFFEPNDDGFQIKPYLRRMVVFSSHNLLKDPPFTRMDLISCRNVLIYFNNAAQQKTVALFHFAMRKDGYLFLGPSETIGHLESEFGVINSKWRIYQKKRDVRLMESVSMLPPSGTERDGFTAQNIRQSNTLGRGTANLGPARQAHNDTLKELLRRYAPPGFLLNAEGEIAHVFGNAGDFLKVESGVFSNKIVDLVDDELKIIVGSGLERVKTATKSRFERRVPMHTQELGPHSVVVTIEMMSSEDAPQPFLLLTLETVVRQAEPIEIPLVQALDASEANEILQTRIAELERDLRSTEESLQSTIEELETSNEELQATNEELMASNEELQSTNEELHSVNEELFTVSTEHQSKITELMEATDDMDHLLRATNIGIVFLDKKNDIRRFTPSAAEVFNILSQDVGRPIDHITSRFDDIQLIDVIDRVGSGSGSGGGNFEREVVVGDRTFMLRVLPYLTSLKKVAGTVITSIDITDIKKAELERTETTRKYEAIVRDLTDFLLRWSPADGKVEYANQRLGDELGVLIEKVIGSDVARIGASGKDNSIFARFSDVLRDHHFENEILRYDSAGREVYVSGTVRPIFDENGKVEIIQATGRNVTEQFNYRNSLEQLLSLQDSAVAGREMEMIDEVLTIGRNYLEMPRGVVARINGETFEVVNLQGKAPFKQGDIYPIGNTIGSQVESVDDIFFFEDIAKSPLARKKIRKEMHVESFICTDVSTTNGHFGRIAFADTKPRVKPFSKDEKMFVRLMAQSIKTLIERYEFVKDLDYRRQHYLNVYDQAPLMRCTLDSEGVIVEANVVWLETLGMREEDCLGKPFEDFVRGDTFAETWGTFLKESKTKLGKRRDQVTLIASNNKLVSVDLSASKLLEPHTGDIRYLIAMVDVTAQNRAFERIESQKQELEKANEGLSTFAYVASHDLQEPLRKIQHFVDMLAADCEDALDKDGHYYLDVISGSAARITELVKDILSYTTASSADIEVTNLHLNDVLSDAIEDLSDVVAEKKAKIKIGKLPAVMGDWGAVNLLFQNLISNGLKYQADQAKPRISVTSRTLKSVHVIDFTDNGIGIDEVEGQDVFDAFVRLHSKFEYSGTGIGLAICKAVCDRMNWKISYKRGKDSGTTFSIRIPRTPA